MAIPDQQEVNRRVRAWVALFLGSGAKPVLDGADTLSLRDAARSAGDTGALHATVLDVDHFPVGGAHRDSQSNVWQDFEAEYSIQFFWLGKFGQDAQNRVQKQVAQSRATDFSVWAQTSASLEELQRGSLAFLYVARVTNLTDVAVSDSERQDRAEVLVRLGYTQRHGSRPASIVGIEGFESHGTDTDVFDDSSVYDVSIGRSG